MEGFIQLTVDSLQTSEGVAELNRMLQELYDQKNVIQNLTSDPLSPSPGEVWFRSDL
jgi:hypothetical protein